MVNPDRRSVTIPFLLPTETAKIKKKNLFGKYLRKSIKCNNFLLFPGLTENCFFYDIRYFQLFGFIAEK